MSATVLLPYGLPPLVSAYQSGWRPVPGCQFALALGGKALTERDGRSVSPSPPGAQGWVSTLLPERDRGVKPHIPRIPGWLRTSPASCPLLGSASGVAGPALLLGRPRRRVAVVGWR